MPNSRLILVAAISVWSLICLAEDESDIQRTLCKWCDHAGPVSLAVEVSESRPWWSHWLLGGLDHQELAHRADGLAAEFNLLNRGAQPGLKNVYLFEAGNVTVGVESSVASQAIDELVSRHPSVRWAAIQHPLTRTKRGFNDPRFKAQWHLVCPPSLLLSHWVPLFI